MIHIHVHLLPWHWFWRDHHDIDTGVKIWWRGPFAIVWLDGSIWPDTSKVTHVFAYPPSTPWEKPNWKLRFHP